jgi:hypothetical protein
MTAVIKLFVIIKVYPSTLKKIHTNLSLRLRVPLHSQLCTMHEEMEGKEEPARSVPDQQEIPRLEGG